MTGSLSVARQYLLGVVVLLLAGVGIYVVSQLIFREGMWRQTFQLRVGFAQVHDVDLGTPVRIRGVDAGQVVGVDYPEEDRIDGPTLVWLRLEIDQKFEGRIYADAVATIHSKGLLSSNVIAIAPGSPRMGPLYGDVLASKEPLDLQAVAVKLNTIVERADGLMTELAQSQGTIPKLLKDDGLYNDIRKLTADTSQAVKKADAGVAQLREEMAKISEFMEGSQGVITSLQQNADAIKKLPILRDYVEDAVASLDRPDCERERRFFATDDLFEPDSAVLSAKGRTKLAEVAVWLNGIRYRSEIVIVSFHDGDDSTTTGTNARTLTQKQSEAVMAYLYEMGAHRMGFLKNSRKITALGLGKSASPVPEKEALPASHTQILLFSPRS